MIGNNVTITIGGKTIALVKAQTLSFSMTMEEVEPLPGATDAEWAVYRPTGGAAWNIANEGIYTLGEELFSAIDGAERLNVNVVAGSLRINGQCIVSDYTVTAEDGALAKLSAAVNGDNMPTVYNI